MIMMSCFYFGVCVCVCVCVYEDFIGVQRRGEGGSENQIWFSNFPISLCTLELCQARYLPYLFLFPHSLSFHYLKKPFGDETSYPLSQSKKLIKWICDVVRCCMEQLWRSCWKTFDSPPLRRWTCFILRSLLFDSKGGIKYGAPAAKK